MILRETNRRIPHSTPTIDADDISSVHSLLESGMIASGSQASLFEKAISTYIGGGDALSVASGRAALVLALLLLQLDEGSEVILPTYVCPSVYHAVKWVKAKPVVVDVDEHYCISPKSVKEHITPRTRAVLVAHIF